MFFKPSEVYPTVFFVELVCFKAGGILACESVLITLQKVKTTSDLGDKWERIIEIALL